MQPTDWIGAIGGIAGVLVGLGALVVAAWANSRSAESNRIAQRAFERESIIDERQREFRDVAWDATVRDDEPDEPLQFELRNVGDTMAVGVTVVLQLNPDRETHHVGDIAAKGAARLTSTALDAWMREAFDHEVVHPGYRVHWSSPLGQVSDETMPLRTIHNFVVWDEDDY